MNSRNLVLEFDEFEGEKHVLKVLFMFFFFLRVLH